MTRPTDPTAVDVEGPLTCDHCGAALDRADWYTIEAGTHLDAVDGSDADWGIRTYCDSDCQLADRDGLAADDADAEVDDGRPWT